MFARPDLLLPFILFLAVASFTPGPNNIMLMTSGLNFGWRRSIPHLLGVVFGYSFMILMCGLGLGIVFKLYPILYTIIKYGGSAYLLFLAWKIATTPVGHMKGAGRKHPLSFLEAAAFQWINPKAWVMAIGMIADYSAIAAYPNNIFFIAAVSMVATIASTTAWMGLGQILQRLLHRPKLMRAFNITMALLLVASIYPLLADALK